MKANELRIGNMINSYGKDRLMEHNDFSVFALYESKKEEPPYNPIPLTEEWLLKFGFKRSPANNSIYLPVPELKAEIHYEMFRKQLVCVLYCSTGSFIPNDIKYVHQLQNLYFALTGEELTIK